MFGDKKKQSFLLLAVSMCVLKFKCVTRCVCVCMCARARGLQADDADEEEIYTDSSAFLKVFENLLPQILISELWYWFQRAVVKPDAPFQESSYS